MPYPIEHAARLNDPKKYRRVRRQNDKFGPGVDVIWGILPDGGGTEVQAIRFDAERFDEDEAREWLKEHKYKALVFEPAEPVEKFNPEHDEAGRFASGSGGGVSSTSGTGGVVPLGEYKHPRHTTFAEVKDKLPSVPSNAEEVSEVMLQRASKAPGVRRVRDEPVHVEGIGSARSERLMRGNDVVGMRYLWNEGTSDAGEVGFLTPLGVDLSEEMRAPKSRVRKYNPHHDELGRFGSRGGGGGEGRGSSESRTAQGASPAKLKRALSSQAPTSPKTEDKDLDVLQVELTNQIDEAKDLGLDDDASKLEATLERYNAAVKSESRKDEARQAEGRPRDRAREEQIARNTMRLRDQARAQREARLRSHMDEDVEKYNPYHDERGKFGSDGGGEGGKPSRSGGGATKSPDAQRERQLLAEQHENTLDRSEKVLLKATAREHLTASDAREAYDQLDSIEPKAKAAAEELKSIARENTNEHRQEEYEILAERASDLADDPEWTRGTRVGKSLSDEDTELLTLQAEFISKRDDAGFVLARVLVPEKVDHQGDVVSKAVIEETAHDFMANCRNVGFMHKQRLPANSACVVENYLQRGDGELDGKAVTDGTWLMGLRISHPGLRQLIRDGKITGVSVAGYGVRRTEEE